MTTRCKFTCISITKLKSWEHEPKPGREYHYEAKFSAVTSGSEENDRFFAATPSATMDIRTFVHNVFEVGAEYYVDISPAPTPS